MLKKAWTPHEGTWLKGGSREEQENQNRNISTWSDMRGNENKKEKQTKTSATHDSNYAPLLNSCFSKMLVNLSENMSSVVQRQLKHFLLNLL